MCEKQAHTTWTAVAGLAPGGAGPGQPAEEGPGQPAGARPGQPAGAARVPCSDGFQLKPQDQGVTGLGLFSARLIDWHRESLVRA